MKRRRKFNQAFTTNWVNYDELREMGCSYIQVIGERSSGKTYGVKKICLEKYAKDKSQFVYLRRRHTYITQRKMMRLFDDIEDECVNILGAPIGYSPAKGFICNIDGEDECLGYATSLDDVMAEKGVSFEKVKTILFDEFVDVDYFDNEVERFLNIISTITRNREDIEIFMCANTISKGCPYFDMFGIEINKIKRGHIYKIIHNMGVSCALYYTKTKVQEIGDRFKRHKYLGFDNNESVKMILYGEWESKKVETKSIDGITWNSKRELCPFYISAIKQTYELSINNDNLPIVFIRKVNTQQGKCSKRIKFNICPDRTVELVSVEGIVPSFTTITSLLPPYITKLINTVKLCIESGRVVYTDNMVGTEFEQIIKAL